MWTLIIVVITGSLQGVSGNSSFVHTLDFQDKAKCEAAAKLIKVDGERIPLREANGVYKIITYCVER